MPTFKKNTSSAMKRTPFSLKSGNGTSGSSFKKMGSSPVKTSGHGLEEEHGHLESGKVDPKTLSDRFSEFNKAQIEKGHPVKIQTIDEKTGVRYWHWEGKEHEKTRIGNPTKGEAEALLAKSKEQGGAQQADIKATEKAHQVLWQEGVKNPSDRVRLYKASKTSVLGIPASRGEGRRYTESLRDPVFEPEIPIQRKASAFKMPGYGKRKK